ncbi:C10 family peptidase [Alistipes sp.]|uniref:C10 family peptidase n=1 Tax=Alistipes sp. TaxID=1872444 RepID=UPI0040269C54
MKQLRLFLLLAAGLFLASCSEPQPDEFPNPDPPPTVGRHAVPIDQALGELDDLLGVIDGQGTRAGGVRTVAQVQTLHAQALPLTRSAGEPGEQPGELLYVVNFEDDAGYAVLGADDRLPAVLAVTDEGSLTTEELVRAANGQTAPEEFTFPNEMLMNYVSGIGGIGGGGIGGGGIGGGGIPTGPFTDFDTQLGNPPAGFEGYEWSDWKNLEYVAPMVTTRWHQEDPFNRHCPVIGGETCVAGCAAIAMAQIVASNHLHHNVSPGRIGNISLNWTLIRQGIIDPDLLNRNSSIANQVALLVAALGLKLGMNYGVTQSGASIDDAEYCFKYIGYKGVNNHTFRPSYVRTMLWERQRPTYVRAVNAQKEGHAWVADGWLYRRRDQYAVIFGKRSDYSVSNQTQTLMHCNFGWGGRCDGFYHIGLFNTNEQAVIPDIDYTPVDDDYNGGKRMITYTEMY